VYPDLYESLFFASVRHCNLYLRIGLIAASGNNDSYFYVVMKSFYVRSIYLIAVSVLLLVLFTLFIKKEQREKRFSIMPEFTYTEVYGRETSTSTLPLFDGFAIILFNPGCEVCHLEAQDISDNLELLENYYLLFLSPDSLHRIETFIIDYQLNEKGNVFYGQVNLDTIELKLGKSAIPWSFVFNENRKLVKSSTFIHASDFDDYISK
jgi:peroxiredoxin